MLLITKTENNRENKHLNHLSLMEKKPFEIPGLTAWLERQRQQTPRWFEAFRQRKNVYFDFIDSCRTKTYSLGTKMHLHHIIPRFMLNKTPDEKNYCDCPENVLLLSLEDHRVAHILFANLYERVRMGLYCF